MSCVRKETSPICFVCLKKRLPDAHKMKKTEKYSLLGIIYAYV